MGHDSRIAGGVSVVSVVNGELKEVCSAKVRNLGEKVGQSRRLHIHPQDSAKAAYGAWFVNDLRAFLPAWQDMELASPSPDEAVTQIEADVPIEPLALQAEAADLELAFIHMRVHWMCHHLALQKWCLTGRTLMPCHYRCAGVLNLGNGYVRT